MLAPVGIGAWLAVPLASGAAGWAGMALLWRWGSRTGHPALAGRSDDMRAGESFRVARRRPSEISRFTAG